MIYDADNPPSFLDSPEFAQFCVTVREAIRKHRKPACTRDIKQRMKLADRERFLADALERLEGAGAIKLVKEIPSRWAVEDAKPQQIESKWNRGIQTTGPKRPDSSSLYRESRA